MNSTLQIEQRLIEAIRILAPDKQQAVLDFAEFLQNRRSTGTAIESEQGQLNPSETAIDTGSVSLSTYGIDTTQAADLRSRLQPFAEDWERPEMAAYDEL